MKQFKTVSIDWRKIRDFMGKRSVIMAAMLTLLVVTGILSVKYAGLGGLVGDKTASADAETQETFSEDAAEAGGEADSVETFFSDYRTERNSVRSQEIAYLDTVIQNASTDASIVNEAQQKKIELTEIMEQEVTVEGLLRAKGFSQVIVTLGEDSVNVVVGEESLSSAEAAQILDIVMGETGRGAQDVRIIPAG